MGNGILMQGIIIAYWWQWCGPQEAPAPWLQDVHNASCYNTPVAKWTSIERYIWSVGAILGMCINVIPKYVKGDEATRHLHHLHNGKIMNPILAHIIAGILTLFASGGAVLWCDVTGRWPTMKMLYAVYFMDFLHQITIHRLLRNHDGVWFLRAGNQVAAIGKMIFMLNMVNNQPAQLDSMFLASCGFLGTRIWTGALLLLTWVGLGAPAIAYEYWYSFGVLLSQFFAAFRSWPMYKVMMWACLVNCATMYFHQLWKPVFQYRNLFVFSVVCLATVASALPPTTSKLFTLGFATCCFLVPHFKRNPNVGDLRRAVIFFNNVSPNKKTGVESKAEGIPSTSRNLEDITVRRYSRTASMMVTGIMGSMDKGNVARMFSGLNSRKKK